MNKHHTRGVGLTCKSETYLPKFNITCFLHAQFQIQAFCGSQEIVFSKIASLIIDNPDPQLALFHAPCSAEN